MENHNNTSPVIAEDKTMTFPEALKFVILGSKITKLEWKNNAIYVLLKNGFLMLHKEDNKDYQLLVSEADLVGEDWIVLVDSN